MDPQAAKFIGAGLACFALIGAGIGIGNIFGNYLSGALRNPRLLRASSRTCSSASLSQKLRACSAF